MTRRAPGVVADGVWKRFRRGGHDSLRDVVASAGRRLLGREVPANGARRDFWALRDISFRVAPGEVLGVIGPNGAGKSTLLKLLTGIFPPTRGWLEVRGKVGALIEVAAGFHEELTGRENVFLQGAVMGLSRTEVARRFDEIVDFSGLEEFIDTPVKRYSSGMTARLGFSVAAFMDPEVLLVDEVLAVGDLAFERKAMDRLEELVDRGIPVVLVSHELQRITRVCTRALLLDRGRTAFEGSPEECVAVYIESHEGRASSGTESGPIAVTALDGVPFSARVQDEVTVGLRGRILDPEEATDAVVGVRVRALPGEEVVFATSMQDFSLCLPESGEFHLEVGLRLNLAPGTYRVQAVVWRGTDAQEWARDPSQVVQVTGDRRARGWTHLEPRMRLLGGR